MPSFRHFRGALAARAAADPVRFRATLALGAIALLCVLRLAFGADPWHDGVAERLAAGKHARGVDYARTFGWWGAAANLVLAGLLLATRRIWLRTATPPRIAELARPATGPGFALALAAAVALLGVLGAPRLDHSFWDDEIYAVRYAIHGAWERRPSGELAFEPARLRDTLWDYHKPSNHVPQSLLSKISLALYAPFDRGPEGFANERATRLPLFGIGLAALVVPALLLRRLGYARAGAIAALLLALHPWHLRYATEARGYVLLLLLVPGLLLLLLRAVEHGTWRRWLGYGAAQLVLVWAFPGASFILVVTNAVALGWVLVTQRAAPGRSAQVTRLVIANVLSAMAGIWLMLPNIAQLRVYLAREDFLRFDAADFLPEVLSHLWLGMPWEVSVAGERFVDASRWVERAPGLLAAAAVATVALGLVGAVRLLAGGRHRLPVALALLLPAPLTFCAAWARDTFLNQWYLVFALPAAACFVSLGLASLVDLAERARTRRARSLGRACSITLVALYVGVFAWLTQDMRTALRALPLQPVRESVALTRPARDPRAPANERVLTVSFETPPSLYDPLVRVVETPEELRALMRRADREQLELFVNNGRPRLAERRHRELVALIEADGSGFERVADLAGSSPRGIRQVYRYRGATPRPGTPGDPGGPADRPGGAAEPPRYHRAAP